MVRLCGYSYSLTFPQIGGIDCLRRYLIIPRRHHFSLRVVEFIDRILYGHMSGIVRKRVPDYAQPIGIGKLLSLIPLICRQSDRLTGSPALDLDAPDLDLTRGFVYNAMGPDVESQLQSTDSLDLALREAVRDKLSGDTIISSDLALPPMPTQDFAGGGGSLIPGNYPSARQSQTRLLANPVDADRAHAAGIPCRAEELPALGTLYVASLTRLRWAYSIFCSRVSSSVTGQA